MINVKNISMSKFKLYFKVLLVVSLMMTRAAYPVMAGNTRSGEAPSDSLSSIFGRFFVEKLVPVGGSNYVLDTVSVLHEQYIGVLDKLNAPDAEQRNIEEDPDYYKLFVPFTFYNSAMGRLSTLNEEQSSETADGLLPIDKASYTTKGRANELVNQVLLSAYLNNPDMVQFTEDQINEGGNFVDKIEEEQKAQAEKALELLTVETAPQEITQKLGADIKKPNFWKFSGNGSFQMSQNYISDNWYKGGESNVAGIATLQLKADYNDNEKVQWENLLDAKLGGASAPSDTLHDYLVTADQLRLYSKFGLQAAKHWYYTIAAEAKTQFMHGYKSNNPKLLTAFLAPLDLNVSLGMDYKVERKNYKFSMMIAPITWTMRYIGCDDVDETDYGLEAGKKTRHNIGSELLPSLTWKITKNISFESRLDYLTSYTWTRVDWENTLNLSVNKYLSTKIYVHARFDDSAAPLNGSNSYYQLNELFSFGINYNW